MKLYKLNQGSTFENLKHFMYITNEYGKPSSEFIDSFIENFGKTILINNFPISGGEKNDKFLENVYRSLDNLWTEIEQDCKDNQTTCAYNYGSLFYYIIESKAVSILKEAIGEQEWNTETEDKKLIYLKKFIEDFDDNTAEKYKAEFDSFMKNLTATETKSERQSTEPEQQSTVKHYRLKAEYNSTKGDDSLINFKIDFNNGTVATIVSDTEININNSTVDIGEYIDKNNIDINSVTIAWNWFNEVYEQY